MQNAYIILDIDGWLQFLRQVSQDYANHALHLPIAVDEVYDVAIVEYPSIKPLCRPRALQLMMALVEETISQIVTYRTVQSSTAKVATALTQRTNVSPVEIALAEAFLSDSRVDTMVMDFHAQVARYVMRSRNSNWEVTTDGRNLILIQGPDYRIIEYERMQCEPRDQAALSTSMQAVANYLHQEASKMLGVEARVLPLRSYLHTNLQRHNPLWIFDSAPVFPWEILNTFPRDKMDEFNQRVRDAIDIYQQISIRGRLDSRKLYQAELTDNFTLQVYPTDHNDSQREAQWCREIRDSLERGDYVPMRDRQKLQNYERRF